MQIGFLRFKAKIAEHHLLIATTISQPVSLERLKISAVSFHPSLFMLLYHFPLIQYGFNLEQNSEHFFEEAYHEV